MDEGHDNADSPVAALHRARAAKRAANLAAGERLVKGRKAAKLTGTPSPDAPSEQVYTDVQSSAHEALQRQVLKKQRQRSRTPPVRFGYADAGTNADNDGYQEATGSRLVDLDLFNQHITRLLPCPQCTSASLFCRADDEYRAGLGGFLAFWCAECDAVTHRLPLSEDVPRSSGSRGPGISAANTRLVLGAAQIGAGETQAAQLLGTLNVPVVRGTTWSAAEDLVTAAVGEAAEISRCAAREEEKLAAFDRGTPLDPDGKVPITVEYDMCWAKRSSGKAYNSLEGSGSALGAVTGKVLVSRVMKKDCDRCRKGICDGGPRCNKNYVGSSGAMESTAGGTMLLELAEDANNTGIRLQQYVTDLDAKTAAEVRTKSTARGLAALPEQKYDPGHWKKGFGKDLIEIKKKAGMTNVMGPDDQAVIRERVSTCIGQYRECGSVDRFMAALWNVFEHIFGRHANCRSFFKCPAAVPGSNHTPPFKLQAWLPAGGQLEALMRQAFTKLTERKMVVGLMHGGSTQRVESLNHVRATIRPKYQHHAGSNVADQRHNLGDLRWNEGRFGSTDAVLAKLGLGGVGATGERALRYLDAESRGDGQRKKTNEAKKRRKRNRKKRSADTNEVEDGAYGPQAERNQITSLIEVAPPTGAATHASFSGALDATIAIPDTALILCWDLEHVGCNRGDTYLDVEIFELGAHLLRWERNQLTPVENGVFDALIRCTKPMTPYVRDNIAMSRPEDSQATPERLLAARTLSEVLTDWIARIQACKRDASEAVVLAGHNAFSVDWKILYWCMVKTHLDAYAMLTSLGVIGVLDTLPLAKHLPEAVQQKLSLTNAGNRSYANKSLVTGLLGWAEDSLTWHKAVDDARGTAAVLSTADMCALIPRAHLEPKALIQLDQLVLAVHHQHNERVKKTSPVQPPAGKTRRPQVCTYCDGRAQPAHATRRTCPKRLADERAQGSASGASAPNTAAGSQGVEQATASGSQ